MKKANWSGMYFSMLVQVRVLACPKSSTRPIPQSQLQTVGVSEEQHRRLFKQGNTFLNMGTIVRPFTVVKLKEELK